MDSNSQYKNKEIKVILMRVLNAHASSSPSEITNP
jgi:predicted alternative tryptophan synthase beta-subunit